LYFASLLEISLNRSHFAGASAQAAAARNFIVRQLFAHSSFRNNKDAGKGRGAYQGRTGNPRSLARGNNRGGASSEERK
jgi:hypothetical protein